MDSLHHPAVQEKDRKLAAELEKALKAHRQQLTLALAIEWGEFWQAIADMRRRWGVEAITLRLPDQPPWRWGAVTLHLPPGIEPKPFDFDAFARRLARRSHEGVTPSVAAQTGEVLQRHLELLQRLGEWQSELRAIYKRIAPPYDLSRGEPFVLASGDFEGWRRGPHRDDDPPVGDLFCDHYAHFISACVLHHPSRWVRWADFRDHVTLDPRTLAQARANRRNGQPLRIAPPGIAPPNPPAGSAAPDEIGDLENPIWARLTANLATQGIDLMAEVRRARTELRDEIDRAVAEKDWAWIRAEGERITRSLPPPRPLLIDPAAVPSDEIHSALRGWLVGELPPGGGNKVDALDVVQAWLHREEGYSREDSGAILHASLSQVSELRDQSRKLFEENPAG